MGADAPSRVEEEMAFGKDNNQLEQMGGGFGRSTFGQQAATATNRTKSTGRRAPYWRNGYDISENPARPDTFRVLRGGYEQVAVDSEGNLFKDTYPFVMWREHFHAASKRGAICSGGPFYMDRNKREPCNGCDIFWEDYGERQAKKGRGDNSKGPNRLSMTDKFSFTVWSYSYYFEMPQVDNRTGQFRINTKTSQPYTEWVKATNPQDPQFAGRAWKQGHLSPWSIGKTWKDTLVGWNVTIGQSCTICSGRDCVISRGWYCGNPNCRQLIFDPQNTTIPQEQQDQLTKQPFQCQHCQQKMYPHEEVWCQSCAHLNGDGSVGKRSSIFDVDLTGYRQRTGDGNQTHLIITGFSNPQPIQVADPTVLKSIVPLDLLRQFAPTAPDEQARLWNIMPAQPQQAPPPPQQQQWAPPPGAPQGFVPPGGQPMYQGALPPTPPMQQPTPAAIDPDDISARLAALNKGNH